MESYIVLKKFSVHTVDCCDFLPLKFHSLEKVYTGQWMLIIPGVCNDSSKLLIRIVHTQRAAYVALKSHVYRSWLYSHQFAE